MPIRNYTTTVPANRSINEIQDALVNHGATGVLYEYEQGTGRIAALRFRLRVHDQDVTLTLPVQWRNIRDWVMAQLPVRAGAGGGYWGWRRSPATKITRRPWRWIYFFSTPSEHFSRRRRPDMAAHIAGILYVVCDGYDTTSNDTAILLTTDDEHAALTHAAGFHAIVYRYDVTDDDHLVNEQLIYRDNHRLDTAGVV